MTMPRPVVIAWANLLRLVRDRLGLFFVLVLPLIIIVVLGLQFGGGFAPRLGLLAPDGGELADELAAALAGEFQVDRYASTDELLTDVQDGRLAGGLILPDRYTERLRAGERVQIEYAAPPGEVAMGRRTVVDAVVDEQAAVLRAAAFAAAETDRDTAEVIDEAREAAAALPAIEVEVSSTGESLFPAGLVGFTLGAQSQLVLFMFLTSLTNASQLIVSRQLGVSRRMLATSTPMGSILLGEALGRFAVALLQGLFIVAATALAFGVTWGDPLGVTALIVAFGLVGAGVAMLIGAVSNNAEQAGSVGVFAGLGVAALGGSMVPPEVFPPFMERVSWLTPHRWAIDGFRELVAGGTLADVLPQTGILLAIGAVLLALATWRLRAALTR